MQKEKPSRRYVLKNHSIKDKRFFKIVVVSHCILNQNSRVFGRAYYKGMLREIIDQLRDFEVGVIQMPCPELTYAGLRRKMKTKEEYDTVSFRRHCRKIAFEVVDQIEEYLNSGFRVLAILGIDGSPTCGVEEIDSDLTKGSGIFIEELRSELEKRKLTVLIKGIRDTRIKEDAKWLSLYLFKQIIEK